MVRAQEEKMDLPAYFDSQAQAAAMLDISIYDVKSAKAAGCPAFRNGGRILTKELLAWLNENRAPRERTKEDNPDDHFGLAPEERWREAGILTMVFMQVAAERAALSFDQWEKIGLMAVQLAENLAKCWGVPWDGWTGSEESRATYQILEKFTAKGRENRRRQHRGG
jgi:hypothetical protein